MPTINQLISNERKKNGKENKITCHDELPSKKRGLHKSLYNNSQKTELSFEKSGKGQIDKRF